MIQPCLAPTKTTAGSTVRPPSLGWMFSTRTMTSSSCTSRRGCSACPGGGRPVRTAPSPGSWSAFPTHGSRTGWTWTPLGCWWSGCTVGRSAGWIGSFRSGRWRRRPRRTTIEEMCGVRCERAGKDRAEDEPEADSSESELVIANVQSLQNVQQECGNYFSNISNYFYESYDKAGN